MNTLVTGGTGFIGSHVIRELLAEREGDQIFCLTRRPDRPYPFNGRVRVVGGDVTHPASLDRAMQGMDTVIHCVQFPNHPVERPRKGWTYLEIDGHGTVRAVEAAATGGVKRFIYLSGAGAAPGKPQTWFRAKVMAEEAIRKSGIAYVIFRPSWVYGPEDRSLNKFVTFIRYLPFIPVIGDGKGKVQPLSVFDLSKIIVGAVDHPEATNRIFEVGGPEILTMDEILQIVKRVMGKRRPLLHHPVWFMKFAAFLMQVLPNPPLSPGAIDFILMEEIIDPHEAERVLGMKFERLEDGLRRYLR